MAPDNDVFSFIKDWLWAPLLGLVAWAWNRNEKEHDLLKQKHDTLYQNTANGYSALNDKMMEHIDASISDIRDDQRRRSDKLAGHIEKLFENAEHDRKEFSTIMAAHREDSYKRHIELLHAINAKADK